MADAEFDVDSSIAAGWSRFTDHLVGLLRGLGDDDIVDIVVPVVGPPVSRAPYIRFTSGSGGHVRAEVSGNAGLDASCRLTPAQEAELLALGWNPGRLEGDDFTADCPVGEPRPLAERVARTLSTVFGLPHPAFLHDASAPERRHTRDTDDVPLPDDPDFQPTLIDSPDAATRAIGTALAQVYRQDVPADENDVFAVPAGSALLLVRAHRSLPLVIFRSPLVSEVQDARAAETEVAILNRDSLWCRYVFDGQTIYAEAELVDRVFLPVNFKIKLGEMASELDDVDEDLARRVSGKRWVDLRSTGESRFPES